MVMNVKEVSEQLFCKCFGRSAFLLSSKRLGDKKLLELIKGFPLDCWELQKEYLYGDAGHSPGTKASDLFCSAPLGCVVDGGSAMTCST